MKRALSLVFLVTLIAVPITPYVYAATNELTVWSGQLTVRQLGNQLGCDNFLGRERKMFSQPFGR